MVEECSSSRTKHFTVGIVSAPAPQHSSLTTISTTPIIGATFTTTPQREIEFAISQISPGYKMSSSHAYNSPKTDGSGSLISLSSLDPYVSPHSGGGITSTKYESVYPRYKSGLNWRNDTSSYNSSSRSPLITSSLNVSSAPQTSPTSIYTITQAKANSPSTSIAVTSGPSYSELLRVRATAATNVSPKRPLRVELDTPLKGYDNLRFEREETKLPGNNKKDSLQVPTFDQDAKDTVGRGRRSWLAAKQRILERRRAGTLWEISGPVEEGNQSTLTEGMKKTNETAGLSSASKSSDPPNNDSSSGGNPVPPPPSVTEALEGKSGMALTAAHTKSAAEGQMLCDDDSGGGGSDGSDGGKGGGGIPGSPQDIRVVYLNEQQPVKHSSNSICTAKYRYKLLFFLPMFLFEQFRRYANVFFLIIALLQQIPGVSPTGRYTTLVPLICILVVSAIKEIAEDIKRHRADDEINNREIEVLREGQWQWIKWRNIKVGDIVKVHNHSFFPADLILLASSEPQGLCYVETANLDGETNLKIRQGLTQTVHLLEARDLMKLSGRVECESPNRFLYQFTGNFKETGRNAVPLSPDQVLLRGAKLQNTNWVFGLVIYTGHETKLMKNSATSAPLKRSTVDKLTNHLIILLFFLLIFLCLIMAVFNSQWDAAVHWYLAYDDLSVFNFGINFITFIILFNNLVPISLQVTLEVVRFVQAGFINNDFDMYYEENDTWAMARTSNLNEELGMVKYVLSDKTGTLTCNIMEFKRCSIGGKVYSIDDASAYDLIGIVQSGISGSKLVRQFLTMMAVCHTVIPDRDEALGEVIQYHAASPDERALVEGAKELGFIFETRTPDYAIVDILGEKEKFEVLNVLEFTSSRKMMSVVVRTASGEIKLYCKGADTVIYERLGDGQQYHDATVRNLEEFAGEGLRTLCFAYADISEEFYEQWKTTYYKASTSLQMRDKKLEDAAQLIECKLHLVGATAIEDKLQDKVPETIASLLKAGMHVWVLTGDKQETAINIGHSCKLLVQGMPLLILNTGSLDETRECINRHIDEFGDQLKKENDAALIIDGKTLIYALTPELRKGFLDLCVSCKSVICCRVSPSQKAEVVELLTDETGSVTLAIGDGANDVAMIQKANVGVGIAGQEGLQAACASDYAIGQFRFLARLLFVHGAWNYSRLCKVILYSFYKNICLYVIELWWAALSGWSGQVIFERWSIAMYNVLFTAAPPLVMGIFDRSCSAETRMMFPELYRESQSGSQYNWKVFVWWVLLALIHSVVVFTLPVFSMTQDVAWGSGLVGGYLVVGNMVYTYVVITVCLKAGLVTDAWTWVTHVAIWGSIASWFVFLVVYSNFWPFFPMASDMSGLYLQVFLSPIFWFGLIMIPFASLLLDVSVKVICNTANKSLTEKVRESEIAHKDVSKVLDPKTRLTETARLLKNVFRRTTTRVNLEVELAHGFAFSQEEHGVMTQSDVIRAYDTTRPKPGGM